MSVVPSMASSSNTKTTPEWKIQMLNFLAGYALLSTIYFKASGALIEWGWGWKASFAVTWLPVMFWAIINQAMGHPLKKTSSTNASKTNASINDQTTGNSGDEKGKIPQWALNVNTLFVVYGLSAHYFFYSTNSAVEWGWGMWFLFTYFPAFFFSGVGFPILLNLYEKNDTKGE
jgi:hypothetical protein